MPPKTTDYGLADPAMLDKIDKLFACGVGELVDLPQIVVVGDQSSGKSSVLEGLIKKPLPRDSGLCTRFATQIVFRRAASDQIRVSIIPDRHATQDHTTRVKAYEKNVESLDSAAFTKIMQEVHSEMGLSTEGDDNGPKPTFSNDVLHLEISGPDQEHLSVIDVPGIFKSTTEGLTTKADIQLVRTMVKTYMDNPRSVMLTVVPANVDIATQEIMELALESDPSGDRTLGVLTKPDLVDRGAEPRVVNLVEGRARVMKLGWHMIRNPGQSELSDSSLDRNSLEQNFFRSTVPWNSIDQDKVGVDSLRIRLKEVLATLVKKVFPKVKNEIKSRLGTHQIRLNKLGPERSGSAEQMLYLTELSTKFQRLVFLSLNANYGADDAFANDTLRIAPAVFARMKTFSDEMTRYGQLYCFLDKAGNPSTADDEEDCLMVRKQEDVAELVEILHPQTEVPLTERANIKEWLLKVFLGNRGFELGTFNATILATTMRKQAAKWADISLGYVSDVISMVHRFIETALTHLCSDDDVRNGILRTLFDGLVHRYETAIMNTKFLVQVESSGIPITMNHYFNDNLQKSRQGKVMAAMEKNAITSVGDRKFLSVDQAATAHNMSNDEHVVQDIHDILQSYYKVSLKTFVDNVCKQAVSHHLLNCEDSPLALFSPVFVSRLSAEDLGEIAGEAPGLQRTRAQLKKEIASLSKAMKMLARA